MMVRYCQPKRGLEDTGVQVSSRDCRLPQETGARADGVARGKDDGDE